MHPQFSEIAEKVYEVINKFFPDCKISLLCHSALLYKKEIIETLKFIDRNILKLDTTIENSFQKINRPSRGIKLERIISELSKVKTQKTIQTLFLKGKEELSEIDNKTEKEINALIDAYKKFKPDFIMVYSFYRDTPTSSLITLKEKKLRWQSQLKKRDLELSLGYKRNYSCRVFIELQDFQWVF